MYFRRTGVGHKKCYRIGPMGLSYAGIRSPKRQKTEGLNKKKTKKSKKEDLKKVVNNKS
jgi:hypothetical protein